MKNKKTCLVIEQNVTFGEIKYPEAVTGWTKIS